jgi:exodeoxyribonuclease VII small subunit
MPEKNKTSNTSFSYDAAMEELQNIVQALQEEKISIDQLAEKVQRAQQLVVQCREQLRSIESAFQTP